MEFRVLGPLQAHHQGRRLSLGSPKQQLVLAALAVHAGRTVGVDQLIDELWSDRPPPSAVANARAYAAALRRLLAAAEPGVERITRTGSGYLLHLDGDELDLHAYQRELQAGDAALADADLPRAVTSFDRARSRWRGPLVDGLPHGPLLTAQYAALEREHAAMIDSLAEAHLRLGHPGEATALAAAQVQADPVRERSYGLLMRARYQLDGVAGALETYDTARGNLSRELGLDPGPELSALHRRVLNHDPELVTAPTGAPAVMPRQLPPAAAGFVGREDEVARVRAALAPAARGDRLHPTVVALHGPAGAGKSALAVQIAHQVADEFPDGQLYVDLLGSTPGLRPLPTVEVLGRLLHAVGVARGGIPASVDEASALFRSVTADRRGLLVLDNAADAEQVAPLLPGCRTCGVLVTSRRPLSTLDTDDRLRLGGLPHGQARAMLTRVSGRTEIDPDDADRIVGHCARLPLAIRIAGARLAARPDLAAGEYARRLADRPLDELQHDGLAVRACIRSGYEALLGCGGPTGESAARAFRALGLLHVPDVAPGVVAAMLEEPDVAAARGALDQLVEAQLLEPLPGGRYRLHDLVRLVAGEIAAEHDSAPDRDAALHRAIAYYGHAMDRADAVLRPGRSRIFESPPEPGGLRLPSFGSPSEVRTWIDAEVASLVAAAEQASGRPDNLRRAFLWLTATLWTWLHYRCEWQTLRRFSRMILDTGTRHDDPEMAAWGHLAVGRIEADLGDFHAADEHLRRALPAMHGVGGPAGVSLTLVALGVVAQYRHANDAALTYNARAMELARRHDLVAVQATVQANLAVCYLALGRLGDAAHAARSSLATRRRQGHVHRLGGTLNVLAALECLHGNLATAAEHADAALSAAREIDSRQALREALLIRSEIELRQGSRTAAARDAQEALHLIRSTDDRHLEAMALRQFATILASAGRGPEAQQARDQANAAEVHAAHRREAVVDPVVKRLLTRTEATTPDRERPAVVAIASNAATPAPKQRSFDPIATSIPS